MIRLYVQAPLVDQQNIVLQDAQSHYVQKVMRLKEGDDVLLFNGQNGEWLARITGILKKSTTLLLLSQTRVVQQEGDVWMLFSPIKPKRQEFLEEKATELGASCLWPVRCERTSVAKVNLDKMQAHAIEAAEQCKRLTVPKIKPVMSFSEILQSWPQDRWLIFGDETLNAPSLLDCSLEPQGSYAFFVGPEGGFTPRELSQLKDHPRAQGVTLSSHILRAETAALVGLSYLQLQMRK